MRMLKILALLCLPLFSTGCLLVVGAMAAGAIVVYSDGEGKKTYGKSPEEAQKACKATLEEMKVHILNASDVEINGRTADDRKVRAQIRREGEKAATVYFRVGFQGNEGMTREFFKNLDKKLE